MDLYGHSEEHKFLGIFGRAFEGCICGCSLKTGILILSLLDQINALISVILCFFIIFGPGEDEPIYFQACSIIYLLAVLSVGISAIIGVFGLWKLQLRCIYIYYMAKLTIVPTTLVYDSIVLIQYHDESTDPGFRFLVVLVIGVSSIIGLIFAKVVWSAYIRLVNNESTLVLQGKEATLRLVNQGHKQ